jgi:single-strand DNA-binding protein
MNDVCIIGNMTRSAELRYTPSGVAVCKLGIAVNRSWTNAAGEKVEATDFLDVVCWRQLAENVAESLDKGHRIIVNGRLESRSWETEDGQKRSKVEINAFAIGPDLSYATAAVTKLGRSGLGSWDAGETTAEVAS